MDSMTLVSPPKNAEAGAITLAPVEAIGKDQIRKALEILKKYKQGKATLENKITTNDRWWKLRHWEQMEGANNTDPKPASAWLFNTIISKHADYMDAFPTADILPKEEADVEEAKRLSSIIPVVLKNNKFRQVFSDEVWYKLKNGTGVYGVFWDKDKLNGLGDVLIKSMDMLSIFWQPGIKDIQDSENIFTIELVDNSVIEQTYPQTVGQLSKSTDTIVKKYVHDDRVDTTDKSAVIDWYYKKKINGKEVLHYCKFVDEIVLYATENDTQVPMKVVNEPMVDSMGIQTFDKSGQPIVMPRQVSAGLSMAQRGWYDHGKYPFVFDPLWKEVDMPIGLGFIDICKNPQASIDIFNNCIEKNFQYVCSPRYFNRNDGGINEEEFLDPSNMIVHVDGNLGEDSIRPIDVPTMVNGNYMNMIDAKIDEMKETAGNRDITTGGSASGVTAASAIAALQETSGKTSRDQIASTYDAYEEVVYMVIELIRQFYDMPRQFRIVGERGQMEFTQYSNANLQPQYQGNDFGVDMGFRLPQFDIEVATEKESAYTQLSQNELALQFYNLGFFNPQQTDQALMCLDMMEFKGKQGVMDKIQANGTLYEQLIQMQQQMLQMAEMIDTLGAERGTEYGMSDQMADMVNGQLDSQGVPQSANSEIYVPGKESNITAKAREQAAGTTRPR